MNIFLLILTSLISLHSLTTDSITVQSEIKEVTVFRQQAQIQREARIPLNSGKNTVIFEKLSPTLNQNSIQLKADGEFTILSLTKKDNYFDRPVNNAVVQKLEQKRDSLDQEITFLNSDVNVIDREIQMLSNTSNIINNNELTAAELTQLLDLYRERASKLEKEKITINNTIRDKREQLNKINAQIRELGRRQRERFSEVTAEITSETAQTLTFTLEYLVYNAGWNPSYDIRMADISTPLSISYMGKIYQNTGIDWNDVSFTINSGNPAVRASLPEMNPIYVGFYQPPSLNTSNDTKIRSNPDNISLAPPARSEIRESVVVASDEIQNQTTFSYKINVPYSITSNGKPHTLEIKRENPETLYTYSTIPKYSQYAYLIAKIPEWDTLNLIAGESNIYFENSFTGSTQLNPSSFDDTLSISLGRDEGIVVDRKKLREFEERNFFGNRTRDNHSWEISLRNTKSEQINITVKDQLPISQNENIKVEPKELSGGNLDKKTGIVTWTLTLAPNQSKSLRFDYQIEYPSNQQIRY